MPNVGMLANISPSSSSSPYNLTKLGSIVVFSASDGTNGTELWKTDGTLAGTVLVKDIRPGSSSSNPGNFVVLGSYAYFTANDGTNGGALWRTDGTTAGTVLFKDFYTFGGGGAGNLVNAGSYLFFTSDDQSVTGIEPWRTDGTNSSMLKNILTTANNSSISGDVPTAYMNGYVYFVAVNQYDGNPPPGSSFYFNAELWRTDGTTGGTTMVKEINPATTNPNADAFPSNFYVYNNKLYFSAIDGTNGREPWVSDGTSAGTFMLKNIDPVGNSNPGEFAEFNGFVYFRADDNSTNGTELWRTDGTTANTLLVKDIRAGSSNGSPNSLVPLDANHMLLSASDGIVGSELFILGGYNISLTTSANGNVSPPGAEATSSTMDIGIKSGGSLTFNFNPDATFSVQSVLVNGSSVGTPTSNAFTNVTSNQTLNVTFGTGPPPCSTINFTATPTGTCAGSSNGQIAVSGVSGGTGPYTYSKNNGTNYQSGATFSSLAAGTYQIVVKDALGCTGGATSVTVSSLALPTPTITGPAAVCSGSSAMLDAGAGYSSYAWSNSGGSSQTATYTNITTATTYTVTVTDGNGCTGTDSEAVTTMPCIVDFSGKIIWEHDDVTGVKDATVNLTGSATANDLTDVNGDFMMTSGLTSGSFTLKPVKTLNKYNGVTAGDVTAIQQYVAFINPITDLYKLVCADVNKSNSVTTLDASLINQEPGRQRAVPKLLAFCAELAHNDEPTLGLPRAADVYCHRYQPNQSGFYRHENRRRIGRCQSGQFRRRPNNGFAS